MLCHYDSDFNKLYPNSFVFVVFVNLKSKTVAEPQSLVVFNFVLKAFVLR